MMQGRLIVMEGIDGSGKSTQYRLLCDSLKEQGSIFRCVTFPRYDNSSSALIRSYLAGEFGTHPGDVNAFAASAFYAVDRFASFKTDWGAWYQNGGLILADRYTTSNACHQGCKLPQEERASYFDWLYSFEFDRMGLPKPDLVLYLNVDIETSLRQMRSREAETNTSADIHEADTAYLHSCLEAGRYAAKHLGWYTVDCVKDGVMRSVEDIHNEIMLAVKPFLND